MRVIPILVVALGLAASAGGFPIHLHANTKLSFEKITFGVSGGYFDTAVPELESLTLLCHPTEVPVSMVASCIVDGLIECDSQSSMLAFTTVSHHSGVVRLVVEASSLAVVDGDIVTDQTVECDMVRNRLNYAGRAAVPRPTANSSLVGPFDLVQVPATARLSTSGTDHVMVAAVAKDFDDNVVASAPSIGPFERDTLINVFSVDSSGVACSPKSSLPYMLLESVSSQEGVLSCKPIDGDFCGSMQCVLPHTATRLDVTLRSSPTNAMSLDPLFAQVLVVPVAQL